MEASVLERLPAPGRPLATSHAAIEQVAFRLFADQGFIETTTDQIAAGAGIGRRTLFRYFASKNDIPWGRFDESLGAFRAHLTSMPQELDLAEAIVRAVVAFNTFPDAALAQHRIRMGLILSTPDLQAHATLKHAQWRAAVAEFVAERTGEPPTGLGPVSAGHAALGIAMTAYESWLREPSRCLAKLMRDSGETLRRIWSLP
jgi:mycofactocin system transcriptional regulator